MSYRPPLDDILFTLTKIAVPPGTHLRLPREDLEAILGEAGRFAAARIAPLDRNSDRQGASWADGTVTAPDGFAGAYRDWAAAGWNAVSLSEIYGGAGLPAGVGAAAMEMLTSSCMALATLPVLTQGAFEALAAHASEPLKALYLPRLASGEWAAAMNLTEPQAGSDLGLLRTKAVPKGDGTYLISGQKIFITFGEHDLTANIIHLVLARLPDAPPGSRGISMFLVPKFLVDADGTLGGRNDLRCAGIEHKLGIRGSPTCTMIFGETGGATGWIIGEPHRGLACMFTMMNRARLSTGLQGVAIAEKATQKALAFAGERRQGRAEGFAGAAPIAAHPDVARMLARMRALTAASRAIAYRAAAAIEAAEAEGPAVQRAKAGALAGLLTPVVKAFATDAGCEAASLGLQIHGGMGYVEETGAAQLLRDIRIAPIYEGTNAIQAIDLVTRKIGQNGGVHLRTLLGECHQDVAAGAARTGKARDILASAVEALDQASVYLLDSASGDFAKLHGAAAYLRLFAIALGGALLSRGAAAAAGPREAHWPALARVFAEDIATEAPALLAQIRSESRAAGDYQMLAGFSSS